MLQFACSALSTTAAFFAYGCDCLDPNDPDDLAAASEAIEAASDLLMLISGGRVFGRCTTTVIPFGPGGNCVPYDAPYNAFPEGNVIPLRGPNTEIIEVNIEGAIVPITAYRLINRRYLMRVDGESWPSSNSFDVTDSDHWFVVYRFGPGDPDKLTRDAANELACELSKDAAGRKSLLPLGVKSINLQGVSAQLEDAADALMSGSENMPAVARFLGAYNPHEQRNATGIWSPELEQGWELYTMTGPSGS